VNSATLITATVPPGATTGTITVTTPYGTVTSGASFTVLPKLAILEGLNAMMVIDAKGYQQRLFFGKVPESNVDIAKKYELGPALKGTYDVRFTSTTNQSNGRLVELYSATPTKNLEYRVKIESATYPLTVFFDKGKIQSSIIWVSQIIDGKATNKVELKKSGTFTVTDANATELLIEVGDELTLPKEFALNQNFPNPFNPTTTIRFALPGTFMVSLKVYNVLGEEVANLVDEVREQGVYEQAWDASAVPSGVYMYRLTAFDPSDHSKQAFISVKKLLLVK